MIFDRIMRHSLVVSERGSARISTGNASDHISTGSANDRASTYAGVSMIRRDITEVMCWYPALKGDAPCGPGRWRSRYRSGADAPAAVPAADVSPGSEYLLWCVN